MKNWPFPRRDENGDIIIPEECKVRQRKPRPYEKVADEDEAPF